MTNKVKKSLKIIRNICIIILLAIILFFVINIVYLYSTYERIPDNQNIKIETSQTSNVNNYRGLQNGVTYKAISYNTGFSAYLPNFSFFMDGGTESWAQSEQSVIQDTNDMANFLASQNADFISLQEVDSNSTRTYHIDETQMFKNTLQNYNSATACCYNSPFLFWPPLQPHGKSISNIMTLSKFCPTSSLRRQLPIDDGPTAILDYDRCYSVNRYETDDGKELVLYTTHMSAYAQDANTSNKQIEMLLNDMEKEYEKGNYTICAADFNKQIVKNPENYFPTELIKEEKPFPYEYLDKTSIKLIAPFNPNAPAGTCRNAGSPLSPSTDISSIDGFLVSPNINIIESDVIDTKYAYSDHNPVYISFKLL